MGKLQDLAALLMKPTPPAQPATPPPSTAGARAYQLHVAESQSLGQPPMTPQQFAAQQGQ